MSDKISRVKLESGGELVVYDSGCRIEYFFGGPDERYGGLRVTIQGRQIPGYIKAWQSNFARLEKLRRLGDRKPVTEKGECGMLIRSGFMDGVYLRGNHMRISSAQALEAVIRDYEYALSKGSG